MPCLFVLTNQFLAHLLEPRKAQRA
jgi:hypothetical protein